MNETETPTAITSVTDATDFLLDLVSAASTSGAEKIRFTHRGQEVEAQFFRPGEDRITLVKHLTPEGFRLVNLALNDRLYLWPDGTDGLYATNARRRRLMFCAHDSTPFLADVMFEQTKEKKTPHLLFEKVTTANIMPLLDRWVLSDKNDAVIETFRSKHFGLVLCTQSNKSGVIDAAGMLGALRPEAVVYVLPREPRVVQQILSQAESRVVIVQLAADDVLELFFEFQGLLRGDRALEDQFFDVLSLIHVHRRVRRVCSNCSRQTPVTHDATEKIPLYLHPDENQTYMFGRGCPLCGHAAYRGTIGLDSMLLVTEDILELLERRASLSELVRAIYAGGMRTLMEDGLSKIYQGYTSFEEVAQAAKRPSDIFASVITSSRHQAHAAQRHDAEDVAAHLDSRPLNVDVFSSMRRDEPAEGGNAKARLLVVEDDPDQRSVLELVFRSAGYRVTVAQGGIDALKLLELEAVDAIVCDLMMPGMNGDEVVTAVRNNPRLKTMPFLMLTANDNAEQEYDSLEHGADDYCSKTVKRKILLKRIEKLLERKAGKNPLEHLLP